MTLFPGIIKSGGVAGFRSILIAALRHKSRRRRRVMRSSASPDLEREALIFQSHHLVGHGITHHLNAPVSRRRAGEPLGFVGGHYG
jgi:hypothetical protein